MKLLYNSWNFGNIPQFLLGQINTGEIGGAITDSLGGTIPDAAVTAERAATGLKYAAVSNRRACLASFTLPPQHRKSSAP